MIEDEGWLYPELPDILSIIERLGLGPIQDVRKLEAACARPRWSWEGNSRYRDVASKASALGWSLTRGHGLVDGNKRLGAVATLTFFLLNGYDVAVAQGELTALFLQVARGDMDQEELCLFLRSRAVLAAHGGPRARRRGGT